MHMASSSGSSHVCPLQQPPVPILRAPILTTKHVWGLVANGFLWSFTATVSSWVMHLVSQSMLSCVCLAIDSCPSFNHNQSLCDATGGVCKFYGTRCYCKQFEPCTHSIMEQTLM